MCKAALTGCEWVLAKILYVKNFSNKIKGGEARECGVFFKVRGVFWENLLDLYVKI